MIMNTNYLSVYRIALTATLGGFLFGYDTAVISGAISSLEQFFIVPYHFSQTVESVLLGIMVSGALIGCVIGSTLGGYFSQKFGRKYSLLIAAILFIISSAGSACPELFFLPPTAGDHTFLPHFIFYRLLGGIGIGLASVLSPMYIAEVSPHQIRGRLVSWNQLAIVTGILVVYFINYFITTMGDSAWNQSYGWRWMFASSGVPALLFFLCLLTVPESPRWLIMKERETKAEAIMARLGLDSFTIMRDMANEKEDANHVGHIRLGAKIWIAGLLLSAFQQLVGIQVMLYYAPEIFKNMGQASDSAMLQTILTGAVNFTFTIVAIKTIDRYGRKPLLLCGSALMALFMLVLCACFYLHALGVLALLCVLGFVASFAFSWGPVTWVLLSEMFPNRIRSRIMSVAVAGQWITNYLVSSTFPLFDKNDYLVSTFHHAFSFGLFGMMALLSGVFVYLCIPETKGKSLEEMEKLWT